MRRRSANTSSGSASCRSTCYRSGRYALLIVLQGMDTAGKDGAISHVMSGVNPQGCKVVSFKAPSSDRSGA